MVETIFPGIVSRRFATPRLEVGLLHRPAGLTPTHTVVFIHGNVSSSLFWQPMMLALPPDIDAYAIDLRGFGQSEVLSVDATRGVRDFSDDVVSALEQLDLREVHLVGWSMGAGVIMQVLLDRPELVRTLTLVAPVSPYGFGGTRGDGTMHTSDAAGTGGGGANPEFVGRLAAGDRSDDEGSPRSVFRSAYVAPGFTTEFEDVWVESMLSTATGPGNYPGDSTASEHWPGFAPGTRGVLNTMSPTVFNTSGITEVSSKPPILWIHGDRDAIVGDASLFDLNYLGKIGVVPGWPEDGTAEPQPMVEQTKAVLAVYRQNGGDVREVALENCGHSPHLEHPRAFRDELVSHLRGLRS